MNLKTVETKEELQDAYHVRMEVFVDEQNVPPEEEIDEFEKIATHFVMYDQDKPIAASRLRFVDEYGKLERICVVKNYRGKSCGKQLIDAMEKAIAQKGYQKAKLNAQPHAEDFYKKLEYKTVSGEFLDAGIPHITMVKEL